MWMRMTKILSREGARPRVSGFFFKAVFQSVLIFDAETWVVTPCMGRFLGSFWDQVTWQLPGRLPRRRADGKWDYTSAEAVREEARF